MDRELSTFALLNYRPIIIAQNITVACIPMVRTTLPYDDDDDDDTHCCREAVENQSRL